MSTLREDIRGTKKRTCCICGKEFYGYGNNAEPYKSGICCDDCNETYVIPLRLHVIQDIPENYLRD